MSGALSIATIGSTFLVVGVADIGGGVYGFQLSGGTINGLTRAQDPPMRTVIVDICRSINSGSFPFSLQVFGVVAQTFFNRLAIQRNDGTITILLASGATFSNPGGDHSLWEWTGASAHWTAAGTKIVEVAF